ncbi:E3 ubiquitin-protein ligase TRIM39 isoform X2 [Amia ocellicauda]|uniref:E3 ubiquitin-protein ligase TRIM39 isoform X2 n=1 Tax=Amia ocellicauda TaxID=2972642 RepID=UPI00346397BD
MNAVVDWLQDARTSLDGWLLFPGLMAAPLLCFGSTSLQPLGPLGRGLGNWQSLRLSFGLCEVHACRHSHSLVQLWEAGQGRLLQSLHRCFSHLRRIYDIICREEEKVNSQAHLTKLNPREHRLVDPLTTFSNRKCAEHGKALEFYCREDQCCVCVSCSVLGCHRNHAVASLEEAASEALKDEIAGLHKELFSFSIMKLDLKKAEAEFKVYVDSLTKLTSQNFRELQKRLQEDEQYMLREITSKRNSVLARVKEQCKQIDRAAENKKLRESNIQDMMNRDPFSLIQSTDHSINWDTKTKDFLEAHIADLSLDKEEVLKIVKDRLDETQIYHSAIWNIMNSRSLNFDVNSAHPNLIISEDGKTVSWSDSRQPYLPHEERFNFDSQVLCSNVFSSGTHSWDVWVNGESFKLGIAYCSLDRKKLLPSFLGHNSVSWCISYIKGDIKAWHQNICTNVAQINDPTCIRVQLDYESGTVSFFYLTDTLIHLYTFKTTFSEPVYPAFKCGNNTSIKLS